jgi:pyruvate kinase
VRKANDIKRVKNIISKFRKDVPVIAKLEKPEAVENLDKILEVSDGVMIARGDMGVEMKLERVPIVQKNVIQKANEYMKPVITATQMLESMTEHPRPTRAEVSDVANAILDGTDAVMLSQETASGKYPVESVKVMSSIIETTEKGFLFQIHQRKICPDKVLSFPDAVTNAAAYSAEVIQAKAIVAFTQSGLTALLISKARPSISIIAFTPFEKIKRMMSLYWGVNSRIMSFIENTDELIEKVDKFLLKERFVKKGDTIVLILGAPIYTKGTTNLMKLHKIGE